MVIRAATDQDIPAIVNLLKVSLGEGLMPKSVDYWTWKHIDNPFGRSPVLVAEEDNILIGVRAFMRWDWGDGENRYPSVRAVDTATHPAHQGKGIFKRLTTTLVEQCKNDGTQFIFNTPNSQSRPGYLKMGWINAGRLPIRIVPVNPLSRRVGSPEHKPVPVSERLWERVGLEGKMKSNQLIKTQTSSDYYRWRYGTVPVANYFIAQAPNTSDVAIYRFKKGRFGTELRVVEILASEGKPSSELWTAIKKVAISSGAQLITFSGASLGWEKGLKLSRGPVVTVNSLSHPEFDDLNGFQKWAPTLGDLELF